MGYPAISYRDYMRAYALFKASARMKERQKTVKSYTFEGKGLHTGLHCKMTILPAPADHGIVFKRKDIGEEAL